jgi:radical SAM superfamily enzyme YgiQ (UPF0313 family)
MPDVRYSITLGYLEAAARQAPDVSGCYEFHRHVHYQEPGKGDRICARLLDAFDAPDVIALTVYFWNRALSIKVAEAAKARWPSCTIIMGGNDVTNQADQLFSQTDAVDVLVHGEGELRFPLILAALAENRSLSEIPGMSLRTAEGRVDTPPAARVADLAEIPSPLLSGVYTPADLAASRMIVFETNRGCPYSCAFCYWGGATNTRVRRFPMERIAAELELIIRHASPGTVLFIADANFGLWQRDAEINDLIIDLCRREHKRLIVMTNWAKKTTDRVLEMATRLHRAGLTGAITLSAQSFNEDVLEIANRWNIKPERYRLMQAEFLRRGVPTYTDLIWGLPGETLDSFQDGIEQCIDSGGSPVIYPLVLLNNTDYTSERFRGEYELRTRRLPSDLSNAELAADVVVSHSQMSEDDWLKGVQLRMALCLYHKGLLRATMWCLHHATGARFVDMVERLRVWLFDEQTDGVVGAVLADFLAGVQAPDSVRIERASMIVGPAAMLEELHYQAIFHRHVASSTGEQLLREAAAGLLDAFAPGAGALLSRSDLESVIEFDAAIARTLRARMARLSRRSSPEPFAIPTTAWNLLCAAGQLPTGDEAAPPDAGDIVRGTVAAPEGAAHFAFSLYVCAVWHGSNHPVRDAHLVLAHSGQAPVATATHRAALSTPTEQEALPVTS